MVWLQSQKCVVTDVLWYPFALRDVPDKRTELLFHNMTVKYIIIAHRHEDLPRRGPPDRRAVRQIKTFFADVSDKRASY